MNLTWFLYVLLPCAVIYTSHASPSSTNNPLQQPTTIDENKATPKCEPVLSEPCSKVFVLTQMPNLYGHSSSKEAIGKVNETINSFSVQSKALINFICTLYLPPCPDKGGENDEIQADNLLTLPCRKMCEMAYEDVRYLLTDEVGSSWPVRCQTLPTENCFNNVGPDRVGFVKTSINAAPNRNVNSDILNFAPLDVEVANDEGYEIEVVSPSTSRIPERRYDIANLGDPDFYQGWTDVQATGATNDYCRVIGKGKRRFLSCNLAGSTGQGHHYVSKLGFEPGYLNTWFMRDMDGDGRDDYCRCAGPKNNTRITCMKAGEYGFYGSPTQGGEQHTFTLPNSGGCFNKRVNPAFGEIVV